MSPAGSRLSIAILAAAGLISSLWLPWIYPQFRHVVVPPEQLPPGAILGHTWQPIAPTLDGRELPRVPAAVVIGVTALLSATLTRNRVRRISRAVVVLAVLGGSTVGVALVGAVMAHGPPKIGWIVAAAAAVMLIIAPFPRTVARPDYPRPLEADRPRS